jgi:coenzyme F420-dependent glucose-6-phosphate dehydrogenase
VGFPWPAYKERLERLEEAVFLIRLLWTGKQRTYQGKYYSVVKARLYDPPPIPIPIHIATTGDAWGSASGHAGRHPHDAAGR